MAYRLCTVNCLAAESGIWVGE